MSWERVSIGDLCEITSSKRIFFSEYVESGVPFYRSKEIIEKTQGQDISEPLYISQEKYEEIKNERENEIDQLITEELSQVADNIPSDLDETNEILEKTERMKQEALADKKAQEALAKAKAEAEEELKKELGDKKSGKDAKKKSKSEKKKSKKKKDKDNED